MSYIYAQSQNNKYDALNLVQKQLIWFKQFLMEKVEGAFWETSSCFSNCVKVVTELRFS